MRGRCQRGLKAGFPHSSHLLLDSCRRDDGVRRPAVSVSLWRFQGVLQTRYGTQEGSREGFISGCFQGFYKRFSKVFGEEAVNVEGYCEVGYLQDVRCGAEDLQS